MADTISWPELIVLMAFGAGDDLATETVRGTFRVRDVNPLHDEGPDDDPDGWWDRVEMHPTLGRVAVLENSGRLLVRGRSHRIESPDGHPRVIDSGDDLWLVAADGADHFDKRRTAMSMMAAPGHLVHRPQPSRWEGDDFTTPTGSVVATEFLGRRAWAVELAPPSHKPYPLQMIVDALTGRVLNHRNEAFTSVTEWTSVEFGVDLPDELFVWDGPTLDPDEDRAAREGVREQHADRLRERGFGTLELPGDVHLYVEELDDDTGAFTVQLDLHASWEIRRRPASDEPWPGVDDEDDEPADADEDVEGYVGSSVHRWRDGGYDWSLVSHGPLGPAQFETIRAQLSRVR